MLIPVFRRANSQVSKLKHLAMKSDQRKCLYHPRHSQEMFSRKINLVNKDTWGGSDSCIRGITD